MPACFQLYFLIFCINSLFSKLRCSIPKMVANSPTAMSSWALFSESLSSKAFHNSQSLSDSPF